VPDNLPYLIDGHNLIPKIPGMSLADMDDEMHLITLLQEFCRVKGKRVEVYFDNAPPGGSNARTFGCVVARFIRQGSSADQAIQAKLTRLRGEARNWTVVSSDREIQASARAARAKILPSEAFIEQLLDVHDGQPGGNAEAAAGLTPQEVEDWMRLFGVDEEGKNQNSNE
jgi:hypothetical protein